MAGTNFGQQIIGVRCKRYCALHCNCTSQIAPWLPLRVRRPPRPGLAEQRSDAAEACCAERCCAALCCAVQVWLEEFAWTQASLPECLAQRNRHLASSAELCRKPMFCFQTALALLYWSDLVYGYEGPSKEVRLAGGPSWGAVGGPKPGKLDSYIMRRRWGSSAAVGSCGACPSGRPAKTERT